MKRFAKTAAAYLAAIVIIAGIAGLACAGLDLWTEREARYAASNGLFGGDLHLPKDYRLTAQVRTGDGVETLPVHASTMRDVRDGQAVAVRDPSRRTVMTVYGGDIVTYTQDYEFNEANRASGDCQAEIDMPGGNTVSGIPEYIQWAYGQEAVNIVIDGILYTAPASRVAIRGN